MIVIPLREAPPEWRWVGPERVAHVRRAVLVVAVLAGLVGVAGVAAVVAVLHGLGAGVLGALFLIGLAGPVVLVVDALVLPLVRRLAHGEYVERRGGRDAVVAFAVLAGTAWIVGVPGPLLLGLAAGSPAGLVTLPAAVVATAVPVVTARWFRLPTDELD